LRSQQFPRQPLAPLSQIVHAFLFLGVPSPLDRKNPGVSHVAHEFRDRSDGSR
jgi:hypothetical protein